MYGIPKSEKKPIPIPEELLIEIDAPKEEHTVRLPEEGGSRELEL